jgi:Secretion system C-terminal sorting domain
LAIISQNLTDLSNQGTELPVLLLNEAEEIKLQLNNNFESARLTALALNTAYPDFEHLEKEVNTIWLEDFVGLDEPNTERFDRIEEISDLCPEEFGLGVFKARGVYLAVIGQPRYYWELCGLENKTELREEKQKITKAISPEILVYPNPSNQFLNILSTLPDAKYVIVNSLGKQVAFGILKQSIATVQTSKFPEGMYILLVEGSKSPVKFVVTH